MDKNTQLLNDLTLKVQATCTEKYKEIEEYIEDIKINTKPIPGANALRDPAFYLQVYSEATTSFTKCSNHRIAVAKIVIDINSLITQIKRVRTDISLTTTMISNLTVEKEKCTEYLKLLDIQQRSLDSQLRYYSSVQYVLGSPHFLNQVG